MWTVSWRWGWGGGSWGAPGSSVARRVGAWRPRLHRGVVVGVRVDVVGAQPAVGGLDELEAGDLDAKRGRESAVAFDDRVVEVLAQREKLAAVDGAGVGRAEFETAAGHVGG